MFSSLIKPYSFVLFNHDNYVSMSNLFVLLLNHIRYLIALCIYFSHHNFHSFITLLKFTLGTILQFKFQVSLKSGDISRPQLIKN